jgi:hypothetical protein
VNFSRNPLTKAACGMSAADRVLFGTHEAFTQVPEVSERRYP